MADFNSSLPVRTQNNGDVVINIADGTTETQKASVDSFGSLQSRIADAAGNVIASQALSSSNWLQIVAPSNGSATGGTAASYSDLVGGVYNSTAPTLTTGQQSALQLTAAGALIVSATLPYDTNWGTVGAETLRVAAEVGNAAGAADFNYGTIGAQSLRVAAQIGNASGAADFGAGSTDAQTLRVSANQGTAAALADAWPMEITDGTNGPAAVKAASTAAAATDPALVVSLSPNSPVPAGTNNIGFTNSNLYVAAAPVTVANPVPVTITSASAGTPIQAYLTSASLAAGSSVTLTYTVPAGHTFSLERLWASASGKIKAVFQNGATTIFVGFNSTSSPNIDITVTAPPTIAAAGTVNVVITNDDKAAFDVYATVEGNQIT